MITSTQIAGKKVWLEIRYIALGPFEENIYGFNTEKEAEAFAASESETFDYCVWPVEDFIETFQQ